MRVDDIAWLKGDNYNRFKVEVSDTSGFELKGVSDLKLEENGVDLLFKGDTNDVISLLATQK